MKIRPYCETDLDAIVDVWNRTAVRYTVYYPLTPAKLRLMFVDRPSFDPAGFLVAEDARGIAGGVLVSARQATADKPTALLYGLFDRTGQPGAAAQAALDAALAYLDARGVKRLQTHTVARVDSRNLPMLDFLWQNRFVHVTAHDPVIEEDVADEYLMMGRELETYRVPHAICDLEARLAAKGYRFSFDVKHAAMARKLAESQMPFGHVFRRVIEQPFANEHLLLALAGDLPVGGALVTTPGGGHDWPSIGCECGLFGPTGVAREHRGGVGKVLLFRAVERLHDLNCHYALIPIAAAIYPFYAKAGFTLDRILFGLQRRIGTLPLNIR